MKNHTKKLLFLVLVFSLKASAMESHINVKTVTDYNIKVSIQKNTTIADVKEAVQNSEGISPAKQRLYAIEPRWLLGSWKIQHSEELADDATIKDIREAYKTNNLRLVLSLR